jgi:predicted nuclease of predicted toxin-antitoxin system
MKILFDQNLSPRLVSRLSDLYPHSIHVSALGLESALDKEIWDYARQHNYMIVTKDVDFNEMSLLYGFPPKIIWIRRRNCSTNAIERSLRENYESIKFLWEDKNTGTLEIF